MGHTDLIIFILVSICVIELATGSNNLIPSVGDRIVIAYYNRALPRSIYSTLDFKLTDCWVDHILSKRRCDGWGSNGECPGSISIGTKESTKKGQVKTCKRFPALFFEIDLGCTVEDVPVVGEDRFCILSRTQNWYKKVSEEYVCTIDHIDGGRTTTYKLVNDVVPRIVTPSITFKLANLEYQSFQQTDDLIFINTQSSTLEPMPTRYMLGCNNPTMSKSYCDVNCGRSLGSYSLLSGKPINYRSIRDVEGGLIASSARSSFILSVVGDNPEYEYHVYTQSTICVLTSKVVCECGKTTGSNENKIQTDKNKIKCTYNTEGNNNNCNIYLFKSGNSTYGISKVVLNSPEKLNMVYLSTLYNDTINTQACKLEQNTNAEYGNYTKGWTENNQTKFKDSCDLVCILKWVGIAIAVVTGAIIIICILAAIIYGCIICMPAILPLINGTTALANQPMYMYNQPRYIPSKMIDYTDVVTQVQ